MSASSLARPKFFGLLELDAAGTVLYSRPEKDADGRIPAVDMTGRNFFSEVAPFKNVEEFRRCLDNFSRGTHQANSISFTCHYDDGPLDVRLLMARISEHSERNTAKAILVHFRKVH